jgi:hypothetical protein
LKESLSHEVGKEWKQFFLDFFSKIAKDVRRRHLFLKNFATIVAQEERGICFRKVFI